MHNKCNNLIYSSLHHLLHVHVYLTSSCKNRSSVFLTRFDTNRAEQPQKMARGLKFRIFKVERLYFLFSESKGADQLCSYYADNICLSFCI